MTNVATSIPVHRTPLRASRSQLSRAYALARDPAFAKARVIVLAPLIYLKKVVVPRQLRGLSTAESSDAAGTGDVEMMRCTENTGALPGSWE